ncbi:MAG: hypothetical protein HOQ05_05710 [Corynebacteriales bacterium]|nr:hypothetical protein [Mycobacteriales bacterium]
MTSVAVRAVAGFFHCADAAEAVAAAGSASAGSATAGFAAPDPSLLAQDGQIFTAAAQPEMAALALSQYKQGGIETLPSGSAVYDADKDTVALAGPLYYAEQSGGLVFADTPATLFATGLVPRAANDEAVIRFILTGACDEGDVTFFEGVRRVPTGYVLVRSASSSTMTPARVAEQVPPPADGIRCGQGVAGAALACQYGEAAGYHASFGPLDPSEDEYIGHIAPQLGRPTPLKPVRVDADTLATDLADFIATIGEPIGDITAYVQYATARAAAEDGVTALYDPVEAGAPAPARKPFPAMQLLASSAVVGQSVTTVTVTDWSAAWRRVGDRISDRFNVRVVMPYLTAPVPADVVPPGARRAVGGRRPSAPLRDWLLRLKNRTYEILHTESFVSRGWFDPEAVRIAFEGFIKGRNTDVELFWRILQVELWAQEFLDPKPDEAEPEPVKGMLEANAGKQLEIEVRGEQWLRLPIRTDIFDKGDPIESKIGGYVREVVKHAHAEPRFTNALNTGWYLMVSEKIIAIMQGRSYFVWDIEPTWWARTLSKFVVKTPYGIGLGSPWTMQLAIQEAGLPRILGASVISAAGKLVGKRGLFYQFAGHSVRAIDGPTEYSVYPANVSAKLPPAEPDKVAAKLHIAIEEALRADGLAEAANGMRGVVVIDANDIGRNVLGLDADKEASFFEDLFADNPLGQGSQQTPLALAMPEK